MAKGKEMVFAFMPKQDRFTLETQNGKTENFRDIDIEDRLEDMFVTPEQFVILTAPKAQNKVRYVQACMHGKEVEVELGIEEKDGTHLYYKMCSQEECYRIFLDFYDEVFVPEMGEYKPVLF